MLFSTVPSKTPSLCKPHRHPPLYPRLPDLHGGHMAWFPGLAFYGKSAGEIKPQGFKCYPLYPLKKAGVERGTTVTSQANFGLPMTALLPPLTSSTVWLDFLALTLLFAMLRIVHTKMNLFSLLTHAASCCSKPVWVYLQKETFLMKRWSHFFLGNVIYIRILWWISGD